MSEKIFVLTCGDKWQSTAIIGVFKKLEDAKIIAKKQRADYAKRWKKRTFEHWLFKGGETFACGDKLWCISEEELL